MKFVRFGGANHVRQRNKRAPEGRGIWCFPLGLVDVWYLGGTDKIIVRAGGNPWATFLAPTHIFTYKGEVWVGVEDVPERLLHKALAFRNRGGKEWALLDYATLRKVVNIKKYVHHKNLPALRGPQKVGKREIMVERKRQLTPNEWTVYYSIAVTCPIHGNRNSQIIRAILPDEICRLGDKAIKEHLLLQDGEAELPTMCPECAAKINAGMECFIPGMK